MKFKIGDKVVFPNHPDIGTAVVRGRREDKPYHVIRGTAFWISVNRSKAPEWDYDDVMELEHVYNSPLYQALK